MKLPVIVERNAWTLPQERYNAQWVVEPGAGIVLPNFRGIADAVRRLLEPANLARFSSYRPRSTTALSSEIPGFLAQIIKARRRSERGQNSQRAPEANHSGRLDRHR